MGVYTKDLGRYKNIAEKYKRAKETIKISMPIEFEKNIYRVLEYFKPSFFEKTTTGILVITNDGFLVKDKKIQREVLRIYYYLDILLEDESINRLKSAIASEKEIKKEILNYNDAIDVLNTSGSNIKGIDKVIDLLKKLPDIKRENNKAIEEYLCFVEKYRNCDVINSNIIDELLKVYRNVLLINFKRVKEINKARMLYDSLKEFSSKNKKRISNRLNGMSLRFARLEMIVDRLKNILVIYDKILDMDDERYIEYLKLQENININNKLKLIRE
ncbi:hypothetical protein SAMN05660865_00521 [Caloramator fervidus]|uniref:Uncharacterized protein n=1 Tax=Caloramator fervidus TaxID=29344 RepID=A0A1H5T0M4_9CLOT|nr:hypothetical protein [Caloramator fervidus]SEF56383.1 hypothetical protein SAMN05660865_00521 [Caloramator fervidus]